jgi:hypothetical protein
MSAKPKKQSKSTPKSRQATPTPKRAEVKRQRPAPGAKPARAGPTPKPVAAEPTPKAAVEPIVEPIVEPKPKRVVLKPMQLTDRITAVAPCPYKDGTKSATNYARYRKGMTVAEALEAGCPRDYIAWDRRYGHLTIGPTE